MFLVAIVVVLLSILYLYYGQLDAPSEPEPLTAGTGEPAAHGIPERLSHGDVQGEHRTSHSVQSLLHIYFGSQTGKAEALSRALARNSRKRGYEAIVTNLERFDETMILPHVNRRDSMPAAAVFLLATYGEGEPTDNARGFCKWLKRLVKTSTRPRT
jgi:NADPH-ferrihemoprotein reductase